MARFLFYKVAMFYLPVQSLEPNDLPVLQTRSDRLSFHSGERTDGENSFFHALERASAKRDYSDKQEQRIEEQPAVERNDGATREYEGQRAQAARGRQRRSERADERACERTNGTVSRQGNPEDRTMDRDRVVDAQSPVGSRKVVVTRQAPREATAPVSSAVDSPDNDALMTFSWGAYGNTVKISASGLPEDLLVELFSALKSDFGATWAVDTATGQRLNLAIDTGDVSSNGKDGLSIKVTTDLADGSKSAGEISTLLGMLAQALAEALQKVSEAGVRQSGQTPVSSSKAADTLTLLSKEALANATPAVPAPDQPTDQLKEDFMAAFRALVSGLRAQDRQTTEQGSLDGWTSGQIGSNSLVGVNLPPNVAPEVKAQQSLDLTELLFSKMNLVTPPPSAAESMSRASGFAEKGADLPFEGNGKSGYEGQGSAIQTGIPRQEAQPEASSTISFGSIVSDRLAAVAEQVGLRDKPLDAMLRLKIEGGESLLVGFKDQSGKLIVQVRCADQQVVNLLESQKETIVRHLEAKQISSTISVSPIEEDLTKRQGREQQRNLWGRRREPSNPSIQTSI